MSTIPNVKDTIFVTPCLQELRSSGSLVGNEHEQKPSIWVEVEQVDKQGNAYKTGHPDYLFRSSLPGYATDQFDSYWRGNDIPQSDKNKVTKNGILTIPSFSNYGFTSECGELKSWQKWKMYTEFLFDKFHMPPGSSQQEVVSGVNFDPTEGVAFIVSHHNRLKNSFIPPKEKVLYETGRMWGKKKIAKHGYANNFCFKVEIDPNTKIANASIFFRGFPDKIKESITSPFYQGIDENKVIQLNCDEGSSSSSETNALLSGDDENGDEDPEQMGGGFFGSSIYKYINDIDKINLEPLRVGIAAALQGKSYTKKITIYLVRHGNSLHNGPVKRQIQMERLDSSLTPLGFYQAYLLGSKLSTEPCLRSSSNQALLCCSFLERTQLTGLFLLKFSGLLSDQTPTLNDALIEFEKHAAIRYNSIRPEEFGFAQFKAVDPLIGNEEKYQEFKGIIEGLPGILEGAEPIRIIEMRGAPERPFEQIAVGGKTHKKGRKNRKSRKSRKARKTKKVRKQRKNKTRR